MRKSRQLVSAALKVCDRWDADDVDDDAMSVDIARLRHIAGMHLAAIILTDEAEDDARADAADVLEDAEERHGVTILDWDHDGRE
jgi:hypothetical protein